MVGALGGSASYSEVACKVLKSLGSLSNSRNE